MLRLLSFLFYAQLIVGFWRALFPARKVRLVLYAPEMGVRRCAKGPKRLRKSIGSRLWDGQFHDLGATTNWIADRRAGAELESYSGSAPSEFEGKGSDG